MQQKNELVRSYLFNYLKLIFLFQKAACVNNRGREAGKSFKSAKGSLKRFFEKQSSSFNYFHNFACLFATCWCINFPPAERFLESSSRFSLSCRVRVPVCRGCCALQATRCAWW